MVLFILLIILMIVVGVILFVSMMSAEPFMNYLFSKRKVKHDYRNMEYSRKLSDYEIEKAITSRQKEIESLSDRTANEIDLAELEREKEVLESLLRDIRKGEDV